VHPLLALSIYNIATATSKLTFKSIFRELKMKPAKKIGQNHKKELMKKKRAEERGEQRGVTQKECMNLSE